MDGTGDAVTMIHGGGLSPAPAALLPLIMVMVVRDREAVGLIKRAAAATQVHVNVAVPDDIESHEDARAVLENRAFVNPNTQHVVAVLLTRLVVSRA